MNDNPQVGAQAERPASESEQVLQGQEQIGERLESVESRLIHLLETVRGTCPQSTAKDNAKETAAAGFFHALQRHNRHHSESLEEIENHVSELEGLFQR